MVRRRNRTVSVFRTRAGATAAPEVAWPKRSTSVFVIFLRRHRRADPIPEDRSATTIRARRPGRSPSGPVERRHGLVARSGPRREYRLPGIRFGLRELPRLGRRWSADRPCRTSRLSQCERPRRHKCCPCRTGRHQDRIVWRQQHDAFIRRRVFRRRNRRGQQLRHRAFRRQARQGRGAEVRASRN